LEVWKMTGYDTWLAGVDYNPDADYACGGDCNPDDEYDCDETEEEAPTIDDLPF
jgi:hypothetical protein